MGLYPWEEYIILNPSFPKGMVFFPNSGRGGGVPKLEMISQVLPQNSFDGLPYIKFRVVLQNGNSEKLRAQKPKPGIQKDSSPYTFSARPFYSPTFQVVLEPCI